MVHPRCSQRLARAWGAQFALHPSAGHDLPLDDGDWVAREVKSWLARAGRKKTGSTEAEPVEEQAGRYQ